MKKTLPLLCGLLLATTISYAQNLQISGGNSFSAAVCDNQQVFVWGANSDAQLGIDNTDTPIAAAYRDTPVSVLRGNVSNVAPPTVTYGNLPAIRQVDAGSGAHILGLSCEKQVWAWGNGEAGQLGRGAIVDNPVPQRVLRGQQAANVNAADPNGIFLNDIFYVSGGNNSSFALEEGTGRVLAWGQNGDGELGDGTTTDRATPVYVLRNAAEGGGQLTNIVQIEGGDNCTYALDANGYVWSWGANDGNKLGRPAANGSAAAIRAGRVVEGDPLNSGYGGTPTGTPLGNIVQLSGGDTHALGLDANGNVWSWGGDWGEGQLGRGGGAVYQDDARRVVRPGLGGYATAEADFLGNGVDGRAIYISAGQASSAVVMESGKVVTFGAGGLYNSNATAIHPSAAGGPTITCPGTGGMMVSGTLGNNASNCNQAACNGNVDSFTPVYVQDATTGTDLTGIVSVSDGDAWYYAVTTAGDAYVWGWNRRGELGLDDGGYQDRCRAVQFTLPTGCAFTDPCPTAPNLGSDVVTCPTFSTVLNSNVPQTYPSFKYTWEYNDGSGWTALGPVQSDDATYSSATAYGMYRVTVEDNRGTVPFLCAPCPAYMDTVTFSPPPSPYTTSGCIDNGSSQAQFVISNPPGAKIKWYTNETGGSALNPSDSMPSIIVPFASTNTSVPGCGRALFAEDVSSISGTLMPTEPCDATTQGNTNAYVYTMINVTQDIELTELSFFTGTGWGANQFEIRIHGNNPTGGPWCNDCSPNGNYNGPTPTGASGTLIETTPSYPDAGAQRIDYTLATPYTITAGTHWISIKATSGALRPFTCVSPTLNASSNLWTTPETEANGVLEAVAALNGNSSRNKGGMFNINYTSGATYACDRILVCADGSNCTLPVDFTGFEVTAAGNDAYLTWVTASEENNEKFIVERSLDGINFTAVGTVAGNGNSSSTNTYKFTDVDVSATGVVYYRVAQYDFDGTVSFTQIKSVNFNGYNPTVVPNPNNGNFSVLIGDAAGTYNFTLVNVLGQVVYQKASSGVNEVQVDASSLPNGTYYLQISSGNDTWVERIVKE